MKELVAQLQHLLAPDGSLAFTFIDPHRNGNLRWRLEKHNPRDRVASLLNREMQWCSLVNGSELFVNDSGVFDAQEDCVTYNVYYTEEFMRAQFPSATIRKPVNDERQHCCELT
jgi:hypothetical protein